MTDSLMITPCTDYKVQGSNYQGKWLTVSGSFATKGEAQSWADGMRPGGPSGFSFRVVPVATVDTFKP